MSLYNVILILSSSIVFATVYGAFAFTKLSRELKVIFIYTIVATIFGGFITYLAIHKINNTIYYNAYAIFEFFLFSYAIWINQKQGIYKWIAIIGTFALSIMFIYSFLNEAIIYNNKLKLLEAALLIVSSVIYFVRIFGNSFIKIMTDPFRFILIGIFIYFSSTVLILTAGNQTQMFTRNQLLIFFCIHAIFYTVMVLLIIISFIKCHKK